MERFLPRMTLISGMVASAMKRNHTRALPVLSFKKAFVIFHVFSG